MFEDMYRGVRKHMKQGDWYMDVNMMLGTTSLPWFTALSAFWPGLQVGICVKFRLVLACPSRTA
jgi:mannosidase alpha-like ER degradation enhancer 2